MPSSAQRRRLWRCVVQQPQQCFAWNTLIELCPAHFGGRARFLARLSSWQGTRGCSACEPHAPWLRRGPEARRRAPRRAALPGLRRGQHPQQHRRDARRRARLAGAADAVLGRRVRVHRRRAHARAVLRHPRAARHHRGRLLPRRGPPPPPRAAPAPRPCGCPGCKPLPRRLVRVPAELLRVLPASGFPLQVWLVSLT